MMRQPFSRRSLLAGAAALGGASFLPGIAHAKGSVVATTYPGTWEDAYRTVVAPMLKKKDDIDLELAPLFAMDQIGKAKAARGAPPFDVFVLDPGPRIVGHRGRPVREVRRQEALATSASCRPASPTNAACMSAPRSWASPTIRRRCRRPRAGPTC